MKEPLLPGSRLGVAVCTVLALVIACKAPPPAPPSRSEVSPEVQQALIKAHTALIQAFQDGDVDAFVRLLDPSPNLLIFHPMAEDRFTSIAEIREAMPEMFAKMGKATWTDAHPIIIQRGDIAWITSNFLLDSSDVPYHFVGRSTEIWVHDGASWRLIHAHWSEQPGSGGTKR
jgi:ketosteroid isomerase-like protein